MNTTPEALKQLYEALGGEAANVSDVSTNVEALKFIYTHLGGTEDVSEISTIPDIIEAIAGVDITIPSGATTITENGTYDVSAFETAEVNVETGATLVPILVSNGVSGPVYITYLDENGTTVVEATVPAFKKITVYAPTTADGSVSCVPFYCAWGAMEQDSEKNRYIASANNDGTVFLFKDTSRRKYCPFVSFTADKLDGATITISRSQ